MRELLYNEHWVGLVGCIMLVLTILISMWELKLSWGLPETSSWKYAHLAIHILFVALFSLAALGNWAKFTGRI